MTGKPRIEEDEELEETGAGAEITAEELTERNAEKEARTNAQLLTLLGDLPEVDARPPDNVLFVCRLNPVTVAEDLEVIFSRFGDLLSCEVIRDLRTGTSLQYAFIEFEQKVQCEEAYFKMDNVVIDDRRIHVDFSQSVAKEWFQFKRQKGAPLTGPPPARRRSPPRDRRRREEPRRRGRSPRSPPRRRQSPQRRQRSPSPDQPASPEARGMEYLLSDSDGSDVSPSRIKKHKSEYRFEYEY